LPNRCDLFRCGPQVNPSSPCDPALGSHSWQAALARRSCLHQQASPSVVAVARDHDVARERGTLYPTPSRLIIFCNP
jgi:hypothetical protein